MIAKLINYYSEEEKTFKIPSSISEYLLKSLITDENVSFSEKRLGVNCDTAEETKIKKQIMSAVLGACGRFGWYSSKFGWNLHNTTNQWFGGIRVEADDFQETTFFILLSDALRNEFIDKRIISVEANKYNRVYIYPWTFYKMNSPFTMNNFMEFKREQISY